MGFLLLFCLMVLSMSCLLLVRTCSLFFTTATTHSCIQSCIPVLLHTDTCIHALTHSYSCSVLYWHGCFHDSFLLNICFFFPISSESDSSEEEEDNNGAAEEGAMPPRPDSGIGMWCPQDMLCNDHAGWIERREKKHLHNTSSVGKSSYSHQEVQFGLNTTQFNTLIYWSANHDCIPTST